MGAIGRKDKAKTTQDEDRTKTKAKPNMAREKDKTNYIKSR